MSDPGLTFASVGPLGIVHYARCEPCQFGQHLGGPHDWAGLDDIEHAAATGQPSPVGLRCACPCYDEPTVRDEEPPDIDVVSLSDDPCPLCGEHGACGYDAEGRPLIHTVASDDT